MQRFILPRMASRACPLPSSFPPGSGVSSLQGRKILSMETRTEENDGELLLPYGAFVCIHPAHPSLLSSPLLEKARPFSVEQGETWQKRGGRRSAYAKRAYPRLCQPFFLPQRGTLTLFVHTCAPIQRGFFRGTHEPERRLGNLGERTSLGMPAVVGEGARVCVQGCIIKVQRNLSGWRGPQHGKVVSRLWMCYISRRCCFDHVGDHFSPGFGNRPIVRARLSSISPDFGEFIERVYS